MPDLIDREKLLNSRVYSTRSGKPNYENMLKNLVNDILTAPTVDTEQHAHWIQDKDITELTLTCNCCGYSYIEADPKCEERYDFCPNCGCKMDKAIHRCGDCTFIDTDCKDCVDENETFSEVGGCENFIKKEE